jgi:RNA binding exosome subunit
MEVLADVVTASRGSPTLLTAVVVAVICIAFLLPVHLASLSNRKAVKQMYTAREQNLINVISQNSEAIERNSQVVERLKESLATKDALVDKSMTRIHERLDKLTELAIRLVPAAPIEKGEFC